MDQPLVTRPGVDVAHEIPDNVSRVGGRCRGLKPSEKTAVLCLPRLPGDPFFAGASFSSRPAYVLSASLSQSTHSLMWISDLISIASTCSQPIADRPALRITYPITQEHNTVMDQSQALWEAITE